MVSRLLNGSGGASPGKFELSKALLFICVAGMLLAACRDAEVANGPTPFPTSTVTPSPSPEPTPTASSTPAGEEPHSFAAGGFTLLLPAGWSVVEQGLTELGYHYLLGPEPVDPGPSSSAIFVADRTAHTATSIAEALLCGDGCAGEIEMEDTTIAGAPALKTTLEHEGVSLDWYFMEHADRLLVFSLHDPITLVDRADLLESITFAARPDADEAEPEVATATPTPAPTPTLEPVRSWRRIVPETIDLSLEAPAAWLQDDDSLTWRPEAGSDLLLGFEVVDLGSESFDAAALVPADATIGAAGAPQLEWAVEAISYTLSLPDAAAIWVLVPVNQQALIFRAEAPEGAELAPLMPMLDHMLASVRLGFVLEEFIPEPNEAAIGLFQALISDPNGEDALTFLSPALRSQLSAGESPATLLQLSSAIMEYNLDWMYITDDTVLVTVDIALADGTEVIRELLAVNLDELGWRIDAVTIPGPVE